MKGIGLSAFTLDGFVHPVLYEIRSVDELNEMIAKSDDKKIAIARIRPSVLCPAPATVTGPMFEKMLSASCAAGTDEVWWVADGLPSGMFVPRSTAPAGSGKSELKDLQHLIVETLSQDSSEVFVLYDQYGEIPAEIPTSALSIQEEPALELRWNAEWVSGAILARGEENAELIARYIIEKDIGTLEQVVRNNMTCAEPHGMDVFFHNFDALSLGIVELPYDEAAYMEIIALAAENRDMFSSNYIDAAIEYDFGAGIGDAAVMAAKKLGICENQVALYDKLRASEHITRDIYRIWEHCLGLCHLPVKLDVNSFADGKLDVDGTERIAEALGVKMILEGYVAGIPVDDLLA